MLGVGQDVERDEGGRQAGGQGTGPVQRGRGAGLDRPEMDPAAVPDDRLPIQCGYSSQLSGPGRFVLSH